MRQARRHLGDDRDLHGRLGDALPDRPGVRPGRPPGQRLDLRRGRGRRPVPPLPQHRTQYNGPRVRDTEDVLVQGHKNMSRPVEHRPSSRGAALPSPARDTPPTRTRRSASHAGGTWDPTIYPSDDSGNTFNWSTNKITVGGSAYDLKWIYGDWLAALPRAIYTGATLNNMSYSCGRCHTTGWTSDAGTTPNADQAPRDATSPGSPGTAPGRPARSSSAAASRATRTSCPRGTSGASPAPAATSPRWTTRPRRRTSRPRRGCRTHHNALTSPDEQQRRLHRRPLVERSHGLDARGRSAPRTAARS